MRTGPRGEIIWRGKPVVWDNPKAANDMGVATVHQHIPLVPTLSILENIFLGSHGLWRRSSAVQCQFDELCERVGYSAGSRCAGRLLSIGERQMVSILQAAWDRRGSDRHGRAYGFAGGSGA